MNEMMTEESSRCVAEPEENLLTAEGGYKAPTKCSCQRKEISA